MEVRFDCPVCQIPVRQDFNRLDDGSRLPQLQVEPFDSRGNGSGKSPEKMCRVRLR